MPVLYFPPWEEELEGGGSDWLREEEEFGENKDNPEFKIVLLGMSQKPRNFFWKIKI